MSNVFEVALDTCFFFTAIALANYVSYVGSTVNNLPLERARERQKEESWRGRRKDGRGRGRKEREEGRKRREGEGRKGKGRREE